MKKHLSLLVLLGALATIVYSLLPAKNPGQFDVNGFGRPQFFHAESGKFGAHRGNERLGVSGHAGHCTTSVWLPRQAEGRAAFRSHSDGGDGVEKGLDM